MEVLRLALISIGAPVGQQGGCSPLSSSKTSLICTPVLAAPEMAARGTSSLAKDMAEKKKHGTFLHVSHPLLQNGRSLTHSTHSWCTRTPARCCARRPPMALAERRCVVLRRCAGRCRTTAHADDARGQVQEAQRSARKVNRPNPRANQFALAKCVLPQRKRYARRAPQTCSFFGQGRASPDVLKVKF